MLGKTKQKVFVDTNVLLDLIFQREPFAKAAETLFWLCEQRRIKMLLSITSFITADYVAKRYGVTQNQIREILTKIESRITITSFGQKQAHQALVSEIKDFEDAVQVQNAIRAKADVIVTRNIKDFRGSVIPCYTPDEFLINNSKLLNMQ